MRRIGGGVGSQVIPGGKPVPGVGAGVGVGVGVGVTMTGVGFPVGEDEPVPHRASVSAATDTPLASAKSLRFMEPSWTPKDLQ
jgi:hypothetical protein